MGLANYDDTIRWAISMLEAGMETDSLMILASFALEKLPNPSEVDDYFQRSLKDLGWMTPSPEECLRQYARDLCEDILSDVIESTEVLFELHRISQTLDYPSDMLAWNFLVDDLEPTTLRELDSTELNNAIEREARMFLGSMPKKRYPG